MSRKGEWRREGGREGGGREMRVCVGVWGGGGGGRGGGGGVVRRGWGGGRANEDEGVR